MVTYKEGQWGRRDTGKRYTSLNVFLWLDNGIFEILGQHILKYLETKGQNIFNLCSNGSEKILYTYKHMHKQRENANVTKIKGIQVFFVLFHSCNFVS